MPPTKKNRKSNRRGNPASRAAQPRTRRDGAPPGVPSGPAPAQGAQGVQGGQGVPPGLTSPQTTPAGLAPAKAPGQNMPPGLAPARAAGQNPPAGLAPAKAASQNPPAGLVPAKATAARPAAAASGRSRGTAEAAPPETVEPDTPPVSNADDDVPKWAAKAVEELLTPTYWLDPGESGEPFSATVRFSGRRTDVTGKLQPRDSFWQEETVDGIIPGSGPVAITAEVRGINPGEWTVTARSVARVGGRPYRSYPPPGHDPAGVYRVPPPRRVEIPAEPAATIHTSTLLRSKVPGIVRYAYATLVGLGVLVGLGLEALLLSHGHYSLFRPMLFSVIAILAGVIGGKGWYVAVHRGKKFDGWCIQGFVAGAAVVVAAAALAGPGIPAGVLLGRLLYRPAHGGPLGNLVLGPPARLPPRARPAAGGAVRADQRGRGASRRAGRRAGAIRPRGRRRTGGLHPGPAGHPRPAG